MTLSYGQTLEDFYRLGIAAVGGALWRCWSKWWSEKVSTFTTWYTIYMSYKKKFGVFERPLAWSLSHVMRRFIFFSGRENLMLSKCHLIFFNHNDLCFSKIWKKLWKLSRLRKSLFCWWLLFSGVFSLGTFALRRAESKNLNLISNDINSSFIFSSHSILFFKIKVWDFLNLGILILGIRDCS